MLWQRTSDVKSAVSVPVQFVQEQRTWQGNTLLFSLAVKFGPMSTPLKGFIEVTARDVTIDVDLGILERFISTEQVRGAVTDRVRGLLQ